jgi:hypothetical protein
MKMKPEFCLLIATHIQLSLNAGFSYWYGNLPRSEKYHIGGYKFLSGVKMHSFSPRYANVYQGLTEYIDGMASLWIFRIPVLQSGIFCEVAFGVSPNSHHFFSGDISVCSYTGIGVGFLFPKLDFQPEICLIHPISCNNDLSTSYFQISFTTNN